MIEIAKKHKHPLLKNFIAAGLALSVGAFVSAAKAQTKPDVFAGWQPEQVFKNPGTERHASIMWDSSASATPDPVQASKVMPPAGTAFNGFSNLIRPQAAQPQLNTAPVPNKTVVSNASMPWKYAGATATFFVALGGIFYLARRRQYVSSPKPRIEPVISKTATFVGSPPVTETAAPVAEKTALAATATPPSDGAEAAQKQLVEDYGFYSCFPKHGLAAQDAHHGPIETHVVDLAAKVKERTRKRQIRGFYGIKYLPAPTGPRLV